jgi:hypothetical protein
MGVKCGVCFLLIRPVVGKKVIIVKFVKYILGVNRKTTNIAVMSELGRYPIYFSVFLAMLKYCHRLEGQQEGLLFDACVCNKELHFSQINTWYSSILYNNLI